MVYAPADNSKLQASDTGWQNVSVAHLPFDCLLVVMSSRHSRTSRQLYIRLDKHFECLNLYFTCCSQRSDTLLCAGGAQWLQGDLWHPAAVKDTGSIMTSLLQELIDKTMARLRAAVGACHVPNWPHAVTAVLPSAAAFARRRFGRTLRLLSSIVALQAVLDPRWVGTHPCRIL